MQIGAPVGDAIAGMMAARNCGARSVLLNATVLGTV